MGGAAFDVVLDNNGKDLDTVRSICFHSSNPILKFMPMRLSIEIIKNSRKNYL